jgi:putative ABC transport system permease protein
MQAVGARSPQIAQLILLEGFIISVLSWILAILIALPISYGMDVAIGKVGLLKPLDFVVNWPALFAWLGIVLVVSFLLSLVPAYQAKRVSVREILGYE